MVISKALFINLVILFEELYKFTYKLISLFRINNYLYIYQLFKNLIIFFLIQFCKMILNIGFECFFN